MIKKQLRMMKQTDVFISYRRDTSEFLAKKVRDTLYKRHYRVFMDIEGLGSGDFNAQLFEAIDHCRDFVLILSGNCLDRCANEGDWVRREIERARDKGKRFVFVRNRDFKFPENLPESLSFLRDGAIPSIAADAAAFDGAFPEVRRALTARPRRFQGLTNVAIPILLGAACVAGLSYFGVTKIREYDARYPKTAAEKELVAEVLAYAPKPIARLDSYYATFDGALAACNAWLADGSEEKYEAAVASVEKAYAFFVLADNSDVTIPAELAAKLDESKISKSDMVGYAGMYLPSLAENFADMVSHFAQSLYWREDMNAPLFAKYLSQAAENIADARETDRFMINGLLCEVTPDYPPMKEFIAETLRGYGNLGFDGYVWRSKKDLTDAVSANLSAAEGKVNAGEGDVSSLELGLNEAYEALEKGSIAAGIDEGQAKDLTRDQKAIEAKKAKITGMRLELAVTKQKLANAYKSFAPRDGDGVDAVWEKMARLFSRGAVPEAIECAEYIQKKLPGDFPNSESVVPALTAFFRAKDSFAFDNALVVCSFSGKTENQRSFRPGDILISVNGRQFSSFEGFQALRTKGPDSIAFLRLNGMGKPERRTAVCSGTLGIELRWVKPARK